MFTAKLIAQFDIKDISFGKISSWYRNSEPTLLQKGAKIWAKRSEERNLAVENAFQDSTHSTLIDGPEKITVLDHGPNSPNLAVYAFYHFAKMYICILGNLFGSAPKKKKTTALLRQLIEEVM